MARRPTKAKRTSAGRSARGASRKGKPRARARPKPPTSLRGPTGTRATSPEGGLAPEGGRPPERRSAFTTFSGRPIKRVYPRSDVRGSDYARRLGFPGEPLFTRGVQPTMYRGRLWTMRQYAGFGSAEETNRRFKFLLAQGQTGLSTAFDLPTQIGMDSDDQKALGEVGRVGVSITTLEDMQRLFTEIPMDKVSTSMTINAPASVLLADYIVAGEAQGVAPGKLSGTVQNDILKEYIARGTYIYPPAPSLRLTVDLMEYCGLHVPKWNTISISGYHIREAGSTAAQELAFTLADGITYVEAAVERGLEVDDFAPRIAFFFNAHNDLFEEVAKFRAARRMWAAIMDERFHAKDPRSRMMRFHAQTGGSTLAAQEPENNVVRVTIQALAAVLGGTQSLHTNSMDEALSLPTEKAARIALRTQQIIAHESGVPNTIDPAAGSYFLESLTDELEADAWDYIGRIDKMGGMLKAIERGYVQREIQEAAYRFARELESKERIVVAVNEFGSATVQEVALHRIDADVEQRQVERVKAYRRERDQSRTDSGLERLKRGARGTENLMPLIVEAARAKATTGEICNAMREVFGEYEPPRDI